MFDNESGSRFRMSFRQSTVEKNDAKPLSTTETSAFNCSHAHDTNKPIEQICCSLAQWIADRPALCWDFYSNPEKFEGDVDMRKVDVTVQEQLLIEDLLKCLNGIEGKFIKTPSLCNNQLNKRIFHVDRTFNAPRRDLVNKCLQLCQSYSTLIRFHDQAMSLTHSSIIEQAVSSCLTSKLQTYFLFVAQLADKHSENPNFGVLEIYDRSRAMISDMDYLAEMVLCLCKSASAGQYTWVKQLDVLYDYYQLAAGDKSKALIMSDICNEAIRPFVKSLHSLITKGYFDNKSDYFRLKEAIESIDHFAFTIDKPCLSALPKFIPTDCRLMIWRTAYYLTLVHQSSQTDLKSRLEKDSEVEYDTFSAGNKFLNLKYEQYGIHLKPLLKQMQFNAAMLLYDYLMVEHRLLEQIHVIRTFFFLARSDFISEFLDTALDYLTLPYNRSSLGRIQSFFNAAVHSSNCSFADLDTQDIHISFLDNNILTEIKQLDLDNPSFLRRSSLNKTETESSIKCKNNDSEQDEKAASDQEFLKKKLKTYQSVTLRYNAPWPLSLLIQQGICHLLSIIFHHMFYLKVVEKRLNQAIPALRDMYTHYSSKRSQVEFKTAKHAYSMCYQMLKFVQALLYHASASVFEPQWQELQLNLSWKSTRQRPPCIANDVHNSVPSSVSLSDMHNSCDINRLCILEESVTSFFRESYRKCLLNNDKIMLSLYRCLETCDVFCETFSGIINKLLKTKTHHGSAHSSPRISHKSSLSHTVSSSASSSRSSPRPSRKTSIQMRPVFPNGTNCSTSGLGTSLSTMIDSSNAPSDFSCNRSDQSITQTSLFSPKHQIKFSMNATIDKLRELSTKPLGFRYQASNTPSGVANGNRKEKMNSSLHKNQETASPTSSPISATTPKSQHSPGIDTMFKWVQECNNTFSINLRQLIGELSSTMEFDLDEVSNARGSIEYDSVRGLLFFLNFNDFYET